MNIRLTAAGEQVELLDFIVGRFWLNGVTMKPENKETRRLEHERFNSIYFTQQELDDFARRKQEARRRKAEKEAKMKEVLKAISKTKSIYKPKKVSYKLFGFIPLLSIKDK